MDIDELDTPPISAEEHRLLERVLRFLVWIQQSALLARARALGFTPAEQRLGYELHTIAAGAGLTVAQNLAAASTARDHESDNAPMEHLKTLDAFENLWFPRTAAIIRRTVPRPRRETFHDAFFNELCQQPLGQGVILSVQKFVHRLRSLETSNDVDAQRVRAVLRERGLDEAQLAAVEATFAALQEFGPSTPGPDAETVAQVAALRAARRQALDDLADWFHDWSTTLRGAYSMREQIKLGLTTARRGQKKEKAPE